MVDLLEVSDDPHAVLDRLWRDLAAGVKDRHSVYHTPTLATADAAGRPGVRTVVLRDADAASRTLLCHTRLDAPKVAAVRATGRAAWHVYDREAKVQATLLGDARVEATTPLAEARWAATSDPSRACYRRADAPGSEATTDADAPGTGRSRFAVITCVVDEAEWLYLHHAGHRRWQFEWQPGGWAHRRIAP